LPLLTEISRIQELIYELPIKRVMSRNLITVSPETPISELKEVLRINRISGTPVVEGKNLVGIISLEDLIKSLEVGDVHLPVRDKMTTHMVTVHAEESVIEAVKKFAKYEVGRLPVIDEKGELVGILTSGDITRGVLEAIGLNEHPEDGRRLRKRQLFENIVSDQTSLTLKYIIKANDFKSGGHASSRLKLTLDRMGVPKQVLRRIAIASYEAEMNLIIHTRHGGELIATIQPDVIFINTIDDGPGIPDVKRAMQPGYSTAPHWIHELGFGAGMGLMNIKRCADEMTLESEIEVGTRLTIKIYPRLHSAEPAKPEQPENKQSGGPP
jgi:CBS domain-containing protein/anti-sigma regulatory factor (Ser/Thr protein kinase)